MAGVRLQISGERGRIEVVAEPRADVEVRAGAEQRHADGTVVVTADAGPVEVRCPEGTDVQAGTESGRVVLRGRFGTVAVTSGSGRVEVDRARSVDVRTASGRARVGSCEQECRVVAASGKVEVGSASRLVVVSTSGRVRAGPVDEADVRCTSGRVELDLTGRGDAAVATRSGRIVVTLPAGVAPAVDVRTAGRVESSVPAGRAPTLTLRAGSGRVEVRSR